MVIVIYKTINIIIFLRIYNLLINELKSINRLKCLNTITNYLRRKWYVCVALTFFYSVMTTTYVIIVIINLFRNQIKHYQSGRCQNQAAFPLDSTKKLCVAIWCLPKEKNKKNNNKGNLLSKKSIMLLNSFKRYNFNYQMGANFLILKVLCFI